MKGERFINESSIAMNAFYQGNHFYYVYSKEQIEIQFKYSDEMQEMIEAVQIIRERQERKGEFVCGA